MPDVAIPDVPQVSPALYNFLLSLKQSVSNLASTSGSSSSSSQFSIPNAPTNLAGTSASNTANLTWLNPSDQDFVLTEVWENTVNTQPDPNTQPALLIARVYGLPAQAGNYIRAGLPTGVHRYYWVRAMNAAGRFSDFNATAGLDILVSAGSGTGGTPAAPTAFTATAGFQYIYLAWTNAASADLARVDIYENTVNNSATATVIASVGATASAPQGYNRGGLGLSQTRYYWLKSVNVDGTASAFSSAASATTLAVNPSDLGTTIGFGVPTGLSVTSALSLDTDNHQIVTLNATWTAITDPTFSFYEVSVQQGAGTAIVFPCPTNAYSVPVQANTSYTVAVRAVDRNGNRTAYTTGVTITTTKDTVAPAAPTALSTTTGIGTIFLNWTNDSATDLAGAQVWEANSNSSAAAVLLTTVKALPSGSGGFARTGLGTNVAKWYFLKSIDTSGNTSAFTTGVSGTTSKVLSGDITVDSVLANSIVAGVTTTNVLNANVLQTTSSLPGTITVGTTGVTIGTVQSQADDPITRANAKTTQLSPGLVLISGATTLSSWRDGTDNTKISGGQLAANTVAANAANIGLRGIDIIGLGFEPNSASFGSGVNTANSVAWGAGTISYVNDSGTPTTVAITAGTAAWTTGTIYVYWVKGATTLSNTTTQATAYGANNIVMATYGGGASVNVTYGRTIIDGSSIKTASVTADRMNVTNLSSINANIGTCTAGIVQNTAGDTYLDLTNSRSQYKVGSYVWRQGAIGSGVVCWFGPSTVAVGSETRTNGVFAFGTDGVTYKGSTPLINGSNTWLGLSASSVAVTATTTGTATTATVTATLNNPVGSVTYSWAGSQASTSKITCNSPSTAGTTFSATITSLSQQFEQLFTVTATDAGTGISYQATLDVLIQGNA